MSQVECVDNVGVMVRVCASTGTAMEDRNVTLLNKCCFLVFMSSLCRQKNPVLSALYTKDYPTVLFYPDLEVDSSYRNVGL